MCYILKIVISTLLILNTLQSPNVNNFNSRNSTILHSHTHNHNLNIKHLHKHSHFEVELNLFYEILNIKLQTLKRFFYTQISKLNQKLIPNSIFKPPIFLTLYY